MFICFRHDVSNEYVMHKCDSREYLANRGFGDEFHDQAIDVVESFRCQVAKKQKELAASRVAHELQFVENITLQFVDRGR